MLQAVDTRIECTLNSGRGGAVHGHTASQAVRRLDDRVQLLAREARIVRQAARRTATGTGHLDEIRTGADESPHHLAHAFNAVAFTPKRPHMPTADRQRADSARTVRRKLGPASASGAVRLRGAPAKQALVGWTRDDGCQSWAIAGAAVVVALFYGLWFGYTFYRAARRR